MKTSHFTLRPSSLILFVCQFCCLLLLLPTSGNAQFQRNYGNSFDDSFAKVIKDGPDYCVLGQTEATAGAPPRATVTRLNALGQHQWTLSLDIASVWNDAVLDVPSGDLLVVGSTLPFDPNNESLMGRVTEVAGTGTFKHLRRNNELGREAFNRIILNPVPDNPAFPYYILGSQNQPGTTPTTEVEIPECWQRFYRWFFVVSST